MLLPLLMNLNMLGSTTTPGRSGLGGDDVPRRSPHRGWNKAEWKKRVKDGQDAIEQTLRETYAALTTEDAPISVLSRVDAIVRPVARVEQEIIRVDWAGMARDYERATALMKLWQEEQELRALMEDDEEVMMFL